MRSELFEVRVTVLRGENKSEDRWHIEAHLPQSNIEVVHAVTHMTSS